MNPEVELSALREGSRKVIDSSFEVTERRGNTSLRECRAAEQVRPAIALKFHDNRSRLG